MFQAKDVAFCFICMGATREGRISNTKSDNCFISSGFYNWKDATVKYRKHEQSECHKEALQRHIVLPQQTRDIGETLSASHKTEKADNRKHLLTILRSIRFLARQGIALRGHDNTNSNFIQILKLHGEDDPTILKWMEKKTDKFTSSDIQNEMLQVMALGILRNVAENLRADTFFTIMADEATDQSNRQQVVIVLRHVDCDLNVHEEFIGLYMVPTIDSATLTNVIQDTLLRMNLSINNCRGQCYDGASNMSGAKSGVATNITKKEERAVYTHCYGHALNLAVSDSVKGSKVMRDALDTVFEISKLIKYSPKRDSQFEVLKNEINPETPGFRVLCPTRWTVRAASLCSVLDNYDVLQTLWGVSYESSKDSEIRARILGVQAQMRTFDFMFGVCLGYELLRHTDNLSKTLQHVDMSASEGQRLADLTLDTLTGLRNDDAFDKFWETTLKKQDALDVNEPTLPRRRKLPKRFESGDAEYEYPPTAKDMYRQKYYEAFDLTTNCVKKRFDQPGFNTYRKLQDVLLKTVTGESCDDEIQYVVDFYKGDIEKTQLKTQLETLHVYIQRQDPDTSNISIRRIVDYVRDMKPTTKCLFSQVVTVVKLVLVMPATNATSERTFSALRRIKTYLRSTMTQERLNNLMVLHVHREATDNIDISSTANEFVSRKETRSAIFGK